MFYLKKLEKGQIMAKLSRKKEITGIKAKINKIEIRKIEKSNEI
jgi:hypothetical protein